MVLAPAVPANDSDPVLLPKADEPVAGITFVAFDTETTGLDPKKGRVVEIGAVRFRNGRILAHKSWLINPQCRIPYWAQKIHGISTEMVQDSPGFAEAYRQFEEFVGDSVLIAHNAGFDISFIDREVERNKLEPPRNPVVDSLALFRTWFPDATSYSLEPLVDHLGIDSDTFHRAEADSRYVALIFAKGLRAHAKSLTFGQLVRDAGNALEF